MNPFLEQPEGTYSALSLRRRSVWEAADSGVLLWRNSFIYFIPLFALPVWIAACGFRFLPFKYLSYLALWWLKPLFDRLVLHVVSRRFFGSPGASGFKELRRGSWENLRRGLLGDLLWRRFSPGRAGHMPIRVLERIGPKQFRLRKKALAAGGLNFCPLISILGLVLEGMLLVGEIIFVMMITQIFFPSAFGYMRDNLETMEIFIFAAFCLNYILVESLYVCMGFGLYINSRVEVEGWDLQLLFQKLAGTSIDTPAAGSTVSRTGITAVLFVCLFLFRLFGPAVPAAYAESDEIVSSSGEVIPASAGYFPEDFPSGSAESLEDLEKILASPDFGGEKQGWGIQFKERSGELARMPDLDLVPWLEKIRRIFGYMLRFLAVLAIGAFVFFASYWFLKYRKKGIYRFRGRGTSYVNPLLSPESPESLFAKAEDFFHRGLVREAWAACLTGCLGAYTRYRSLSFPADATEYGCLDLVREALPGEAGSFGELVQSWILLAYGGRNPDEGAFERVLGYTRSLVGPPGVSNEP